MVVEYLQEVCPRCGCGAYVDLSTDTTAPRYWCSRCGALKKILYWPYDKIDNETFVTPAMYEGTSNGRT